MECLQHRKTEFKVNCCSKDTDIGVIRSVSNRRNSLLEDLKNCNWPFKIAKNRRKQANLELNLTRSYQMQEMPEYYRHTNISLDNFQ